MDRYAIYTYKLQRASITEGHLDDGVQVTTPDIKHAYENFERLFGEQNNKLSICYKNQRGVETIYPCYVRAHDCHVVLLRLDNLKNVYVYEEEGVGPIPNIKKKGHESHPNCHVVIDNREGLRQMAIEIEPAAWRDTRKVREILEEGLNKMLMRFGLFITITAKTMEEDYWKLTQRKRKLEGIKLRKITIGFDNSKLTPKASAIINKTMRLKSMMTMVNFLGGSKGELELMSQPGTDELLRKKLTDIKNIVELCGENSYWLALTFSDGVTFRCGERVRAELPMNPSTIKDSFAKGEEYKDLYRQEHDFITWLDWVEEQTKKYSYDEEVRRNSQRKG